jgi:hypothetical protein
MGMRNGARTTVRAPSTPGTYNFNWKMLQEYIEWFGVATPNVVVTVTAPPPPPTLSVQRTPETMTAGEGYVVSWSSSNATSVTYSCSSTGSGYIGNANVEVNGSMTGTAVPAWIGYPSTCTWTATGAGGTTSVTESMVTLAARDAQIVSHSVPASMLAGKSYPVAIVVKNTGTATWSAADGFALGAVNPENNVTWGYNRASLYTTVAPGQQATFNFAVIAPTTGSYVMDWRMIKENVEWFGGTASASVNVGEQLKTLADSFLYQPATDTIYAWRFGNGLPRMITFDADSRIEKLDSPGKHSLTFAYSNVDTIKSISDNVYPLLTSSSVEYDTSDRIKSVVRTNAGESFSWDNVGNRIGNTKEAEGTFTLTMSGQSNQLASWGGAGKSRSFAYDAVEI